MSKAESLHKQITLENHQWNLFMILGGFCLAFRTEAKGQDFSCGVVATETCITRVTGELKGKFFDEKRPFTLYYTPVDQNKEIAAMFSFMTFYKCEAATGFICDEEIIQISFSVSINPDTPCKEGIFSLSTYGENHPVICHPTLRTSEQTAANENIHTKTDVQCKNEKGCAGLKCPETLPKDGPQTQSEENLTVVALSITLGIFIAIVVCAIVLIIVYRKRLRQATVTQSLPSTMKATKEENASFLNSNGQTA